jgi:hypothetical protein
MSVSLIDEFLGSNTGFLKQLITFEFYPFGLSCADASRRFQERKSWLTPEH